MNEILEQNKNNAIAFYKMAYVGNPKEATELHVQLSSINDKDFEVSKQEKLVTKNFCKING